MVSMSVLALRGQTFQARPLGSAYQAKINQFKKWVDETADVAPTTGKYVTRKNVDLFFLMHLLHRDDIQSQNLKQYKNALKQYANNVEYPPPATPIQVDSPAVEQVIKQHREQYIVKRKNKPQSLHANIMANVLSEDEKRTLVMTSMTFPSWLDLTFSLTTMNQTGVRGDTLRNCIIPSLWIDRTHGPSKHPMMGLLEPDMTGKVLKSVTKYRGMWRHKELLFCGTGWMACSLIYKFSHYPEYMNTSFHHADKDINPDWYKLRLVGWDDYKPMYNVYDRLYKTTKIKWAKCTHFRRQMIDDAQSNRATASEVSLVTGHGESGNLEKFYALDNPPDVMHSCCGFDRDQPYYCDRWLVDVNDPDYPLIERKFDTTAEDLCHKLVPNYRLYLQQYHTSLVKWPCAKNFLEQILPFLCHVYVTDQPTRQQHFAQHEISILFIQVFGTRGVEWCNRQLVLSQDKLSAAKRASIAQADRSNQEMFLTIQDHIQVNSRNTRNDMRQFFSVICQQGSPQESSSMRGIAATQAPWLVGAQRVRPINVTTNQTGQRATNHSADMAQLTRYAPSVVTAPGATNIPSIGNKLPNSAVDIVKDHYRLELEKYQNVSKKDWGSFAMRYSRRLNAMNLIVKEASVVRHVHSRGEAVLVAATKIDTEKGSDSFTKWMNTKRKTKSRNSVQLGVKRQRLFACTNSLSTIA
jgi:hypothetical protein